MDSVSKVKMKTHHVSRIDYSFAQWQADLRRFYISRALHRYLKKHEVRSLYPIPRGGMIPAIYISHWFDLPIVEKDQIDKHTLIVDDIVDSGNTIKEYVESNPTFAIYINRDL